MFTREEQIGQRSNMVASEKRKHIDAETLMDAKPLSQVSPLLPQATPATIKGLRRVLTSTRIVQWEADGHTRDFTLRCVDTTGRALLDDRKSRAPRSSAPSSASHGFRGGLFPMSYNSLRTRPPWSNSPLVGCETRSLVPIVQSSNLLRMLRPWRLSTIAAFPKLYFVE